MTGAIAGMENIIQKLMSPDNAIIHQGTAELREAFKHPNTAEILCQILICSENAQIRQYSGILLRKRFHKGKYWMQMSENTRKSFKHLLMQSLMNEQQRPVRNAATQLIGVILKYELPHNGWPEVLMFTQQLLSSNNMNEREIGMYTLSILTEISPDTYLSHTHTIVNLLHNVLNTCNDPSSSLPNYILSTLMNLAPLTEGNQEMVNAYHQLMPQVINIIQTLATTDSEKAVKGFELLEELCDSALTVIAPQVKNLVEMCLNISNNQSLNDDIRAKAVLFLGTLIKTKKKSIVKNKLVEHIVASLYSLMTAKSVEEKEDVYFTGELDNTPLTSATQTLDLLALHVPPEKLVPHMLKYIEPSLKDSNPYAKKAAYLSMAILAEGCAEYIRTKYLETFLRCICQGITDTNTTVRNAALFALGQFAEHLQPDISQFSSDLLPILFKHLSEICMFVKQENTEALTSADRMFYALEVFAENLNEALLPYLPNYMEIILEILNSNCPIHVSELALSAIGAAANASKEHMVPYLEKIIMILDRYLLERLPDDKLCLQIQSIDTLGVIARSIGVENFFPLASKTLQIVLSLLKETEDPDLKKSLYSLLASLSMVVKKDMGAVLPQVYETIISSIQNTDGVMSIGKDYDVPNYAVYDNFSDSENGDEDIENTDNEDDDDDDDTAGYSVDNAYIEEKEEAILALSEIAQHSQEAFLPYLEKSFEEVMKLVNYPQEDIRKASVDALQQFCINFYRIPNIEGKQAAHKAISLFVPKLSELIRLDEERSVVMESLEAFSELLKEMKSDLFSVVGHKEAIINCIKEVMLGETECQDQDDDGDDGEAEHDELLFEYAGELLVNFGKAISTEEFSNYFRTILPILLKRMQTNHSDSQRSFSVGNILECFSVLQDKTVLFLAELFPIFMKLTNDPNDEIRSNAIFGIGELAYYGKEHLFPHYLEILQVLSNVIAKETHAGARDNIIGAIARLIITNHTIIPLDLVFPVFVNHLPLKEDMEENKTVFKSILVLYQHGSCVLKPHIKHLFKVGVDVLHQNKCDNETNGIIFDFLKSAKQDFGEEWNSFYSELPPEIATKLQEMCM